MVAWRSQQTTSSWAVFLVGAFSLALVVLGSAVLLLSGGITPYENLLDTMRSDAQKAVLYAAMLLGLAASVSGFVLFRRMPTKHSREATISGAALGVQAVLFGAVYLIFSSGTKFDIFVRQYLSFDIIPEFFGDFLNGAKNTVILAAVGEGLGIILGLLLSLLILSKRSVVRAPARLYINFFRGTPLLLQLSMGFVLLVLSLGLRDLGPFEVGALILGLNAGAYTAEIFRAGIQSLERGQMEAARSLGMSYGKAMRYVILPQAFRRVIPPLTNEFIILIKDTSLIVILGLTSGQRELFAVGRDLYSETFNATPYIASAIGYLAVTLPMIRYVTSLEKRLRSGLTGIVG